MNRKFFTKISVTVVAAMALLALVQTLWVLRMHSDQINDYKRRVESAAYKSIYKAFRLDALPGIESANIIKLDLEEFDLYFTANLLELDITSSYFAEILSLEQQESVLMSYGNRESIGEDFMVSRIVIDDDNTYLLQLTTHLPTKQLWHNMGWLLLSSVAIVLLLAALLFYLIKTMFRERTLEQMRKDFTCNITHELKTPIAVATAATDALKNYSADSDPQKRVRYFEIIEKQLNQLSGMVDRILSLTVEGREIKIALEEIDLTPFFNSYMKEISNMAARFTLECKDDIRILGDHFHLKNVISTIVDNSIKYSDGAPKIGISVEKIEGMATITISDNGCGISQENLKHIFEKFYRVPLGDVQKNRGYGLGLYYAKSIIEAHGGKISVKSSIGDGTTIFIKIPPVKTDKR